MFNRLLFVGVTFFLFNGLNAQMGTVKDKQRALFVLNIAQGFEWSVDASHRPFNLVILEDSILFKEIKQLSKNRKIGNREIKPLFQLSLNQFSKADLIYANKKSGFNAARILKIINQRNILLVGENYQFNECMVNLLDVSDDFNYELNHGKIKAHGFNVSASLEEHSISSESKWFEMYQESQHSLKDEQKVSVNRKKVIDDQEVVLLHLENNIKRLNVNVDGLRKQIEIKSVSLDSLKQSIKDKNDVLNGKISEINDLEFQMSAIDTKLKKQLLLIDSFNLEIMGQSVKLKNQIETIANQNKKVEKQKIVLEKQTDELKLHQRINFLLLLLLVLLGVIMFLLYRFYVKSKKYNRVLKLKNQEILDRNEEIEQFSYIASHDLQAPLNTIIGFLSLLEHKLKGKLDEDDMINMGFIKSSSDRMKQLIKDLLDYSQIGEDAVYEKININDVLNVVKQDLKVDIDTSSANINIINSNDIIIIGLATEIRLLFQNLISNAIKFKKSDQAPIININVSQIEDSSVIKTYCFVEDNGIGIEKKYREKVFKVFNRLHNDTDYQGTGIGLAHCKKVVNRHLGEIWVEESSLGGVKICFFIVHNK